MTLTLDGSRAYFKKLNSDLKSFHNNLIEEIEEEGANVLEIGKVAAQLRIEELNRIDTGRMLNYVKGDTETSNNGVTLTLSDEVLDNPKNNGYDYVPDQEYSGYNSLTGAYKEPVRMMDAADEAMDPLLEDLFEDVVSQAWLETTQGDIPF